MKNQLRILFVSSLIAFSGILVGSSMSLAQEATVAGIYLLIEVNGKNLPAVSETKMSNGVRCNEETLEGALIFNSDGRYAAFITSREICLHEDGSKSITKEESEIWPGSYKISDNQVTLQYDFELWPDPDHAVLKGGLLVYESGGEGQAITEFVFRRV